MGKDEAVKAAVRECVKKGILADFLREHGSEVENMLLTEWNWDDALEVWRKEGWEDGMEIGMERGMEKGKREGKLEIALNMKNFKIPPEEIAKYTGLPPEKIAEL
jgi:predicted transposase/invertase (TIGR01784 family)